MCLGLNLTLVIPGKLGDANKTIFHFNLEDLNQPSSSISMGFLIVFDVGLERSAKTGINDACQELLMELRILKVEKGSLAKLGHEHPVHNLQEGNRLVLMNDRGNKWVSGVHDS